MSKKSGIDLLNDLINKLITMEQKIDVLDHNIKHIANTTNIADLVKQAKDTAANQWVVNHGTPNKQIKDEISLLKEKIKKIQNDKPETHKEDSTYQKARLKLKEAINKDLKNKNKEIKGVGPKVILKGKATEEINGKKVNLSLAEISIYAQDGYNVKNVKANMAGDWSALVFKHEKGETEYTVKINAKYKGSQVEEQIYSLVVNENDKEVAVNLENTNNFVSKGLKPRAKNKSTVHKKELVTNLQEGKVVDLPSSAKVHVKARASSLVDGKNILLTMAQVIIKDSKHNIVKNTKTNAAGQWGALLPKNDDGYTYYIATISSMHNGMNLEQNLNFLITQDDKDIDLDNSSQNIIKKHSNVSSDIGNSKIYVRGKVTSQIDGKTVNISFASIKVYDDQDNLIKETKSNMSGEWNLLLPKKSESVTNYVAEITGKYKGKDIVPQNIAFVVKESDKEVKI